MQQRLYVIFVIQLIIIIVLCFSNSVLLLTSGITKSIDLHICFENLPLVCTSIVNFSIRFITRSPTSSSMFFQSPSILLYISLYSLSVSLRFARSSSFLFSEILNYLWSITNVLPSTLPKPLPSLRRLFNLTF